jgi:hypothetical protein
MVLQSMLHKVATLYKSPSYAGKHQISESKILTINLTNQNCRRFGYEAM